MKSWKNISEPRQHDLEVILSDEEVYLKDYATVKEAILGLGAHFKFYNEERPQQALKYKTPHQLYTARRTHAEQPDNNHPVPRSIYNLKKVHFLS